MYSEEPYTNVHIKEVAIGCCGFSYVRYDIITRIVRKESLCIGL